VTPEQRIARSHNAERAWDEFIAPMFADMRNEYLKRMTDVAATELHAGQRADKITSLSVALRVLDNIESGMREAIRDGDIATKEKLRAQNLEGMSDARQRLLKVVGY
jgi:hypothetical protein